MGLWNIVRKIPRFNATTIGAEKRCLAVSSSTGHHRPFKVTTTTSRYHHYLPSSSSQQVTTSTTRHMFPTLFNRTSVTVPRCYFGSGAAVPQAPSPNPADLQQQQDQQLKLQQQTQQQQQASNNNSKKQQRKQKQSRKKKSPDPLSLAAKEADRITDLAGRRKLVNKKILDGAAPILPSPLSAKQSQSAQLQQYPKEKREDDVQTSRHLINIDDNNNNNADDAAEQAFDAARSLLVVSRPSHALADAILQQQQLTSEAILRDEQKPAALPSAEIASLHRAFLALTSWCLDAHDMRLEQRFVTQQRLERQEQYSHLLVPGTKQSSSSSEENLQSASTNTTPDLFAITDHDILDRTLTVARRAHDLNLPLHLPLYQRLMLAVARQYHYNPYKKDSAEIRATCNKIFEISSWISSRLNVSAVTPHLFAPVLIEFAERRHFQPTHQVLVGMKSMYGIREVGIDLAIQIWGELKEAATFVDDKELVIDQSMTTADLEAANDITELLDETIVKHFESVEDLISLSPFLTSQDATDSEIDSDNDDDDDDDDDDDSENETEQEADDDDKVNAVSKVIDIPVTRSSKSKNVDGFGEIIESMLAQGMSHREVTKVVAEVIKSIEDFKRNRKMRGDKGVILPKGYELDRIKIQNFRIKSKKLDKAISEGAKTDFVQELTKMLDEFDAKEGSDDDDDVDSDEETAGTIGDRQTYYSRGAPLPDILDQVERLIKRGKLSFTSEYEDILEMRDQEWYGAADYEFGEDDEGVINIPNAEDDDDDDDDDF